MDGEVVQVIESSTDLTPVLESLDMLYDQLRFISVSLCVLCGVVLGAMVVLLLAEVFR